MEKPKFLYHYTSFYSGMCILKSGTLRLYEARNQKDVDEIIYMGNLIVDFLYDIINSHIADYKETQIQAFIAMILFFSKYYADNDRFKMAEQSLLNVPKENNYHQIFEDIDNRDIKFFISCFTNSNKNSFLWKNYASDGEGFIIKLRSDNLPPSIGIKPVYYNVEEINKYMIGAITAYYNQTTDLMEYLNKLSIEFTHLCLSGKKEGFSLEKETRLIEHHDSVEYPKIIEIDQYGKEFVLLPLKDIRFIKRISAIYYTEKASKENLIKIKKILDSHRKYQEIELIKIKYSDII